MGRTDVRTNRSILQFRINHCLSMIGTTGVSLGTVHNILLRAQKARKILRSLPPPSANDPITKNNHAIRNITCSPRLDDKRRQMVKGGNSYVTAILDPAKGSDLWFLTLAEECRKYRPLSSGFLGCTFVNLSTRGQHANVICDIERIGSILLDQHYGKTLLP